MRNEKYLNKYSGVLLTIVSILLGTLTWTCLFAYDAWPYVYLVIILLITAGLVFACWRINDKFMNEEPLGIIYQIAMTTVIPFGLGNFSFFFMAV